MQNIIPTAEFRDLFRPDPDLGHLTISSDWIWNYTAGELPMLAAYEQFVLAALVRSVSPKYVVELGTGRGSGTVSLACNAPADAKVFTFDLDQRHRDSYTAKILRGEPEIGVAYHRRFGAERIVQNLVVPGVKHERIESLAGAVDLIFVDGDHTYDGVRADTEIAVELANPEAVILWHDFYDFPAYLQQGKQRGVFPWLNEFAAVQSDFKLYHIAGTYMVAGRRKWPDGVKTIRVRQPGDRPQPFGDRIARLGDA